MCEKHIKNLTLEDNEGDEVGLRSAFENIDEDFCKGSMLVIHTSQDSGLANTKAIQLGGKRYQNLDRRILKNARQIMHMETRGNCCWKLFERANFLGKSLDISLGFQGRPTLNPKSIKQVECE